MVDDDSDEEGGDPLPLLAPSGAPRAQTALTHGNIIAVVKTVDRVNKGMPSCHIDAVVDIFQKVSFKGLAELFLCHIKSPRFIEATVATGRPSLEDVDSGDFIHPRLGLLYGTYTDLDEPALPDGPRGLYHGTSASPNIGLVNRTPGQQNNAALREASAGDYYRTAFKVCPIGRASTSPADVSPVVTTGSFRAGRSTTRQWATSWPLCVLGTSPAATTTSAVASAASSRLSASARWSVRPGVWRRGDGGGGGRSALEDRVVELGRRPGEVPGLAHVCAQRQRMGRY